MDSGPDTTIADILYVYVTDEGEIRVNVGEGSTNDGFGSSVEVWGNGDGFISCPNMPSDGAFAQCLLAQEGHVKRVWGIRDGRYINKVGALKPGDRAIVSSSAARLFLKNAIAAISLYTENQQDNNSSQIIENNGEKGAIRAVCGQSYITMDKDKILIGVGGTCIQISDDGVFIYGKHFAANTGGGNLGTIGPLPPPPGTNSICAGPAGNIAVASSRWTVSL